MERSHHIFDEKKISLAISENLLHYYAQYMSWKSFFELYFYSLNQQLFGRNKRFYCAPLIKLKRLFKPI